MLWTLIVVLVVLWLLGFSLSVGGSLIHLLLVLAVIVVAYQLADSTGRRNNLSVRLAWFQPTQGLSRPPVDLSSDSVELGLGVDREVGALREVLAQEAVGVLVAAPLPRAVGVAEVDLDAGVDGEACVLGHLLAAIPGEGTPQLRGKLQDLGGESGAHVFR